LNYKFFAIDKMVWKIIKVSYSFVGTGPKPNPIPQPAQPARPFFLLLMEGRGPASDPVRPNYRRNRIFSFQF
jgi:hypothetical protein